MPDSDIEWNPGATEELNNSVRANFESVRASLQQSYDEKVQRVISAVDVEMSGQPVEDILIALQVHVRQAGFEPEAGLRSVAEAISNQTLK